jgi:hypothetical protein
MRLSLEPLWYASSFPARNRIFYVLWLHDQQIPLGSAPALTASLPLITVSSCSLKPSGPSGAKPWGVHPVVNGGSTRPTRKLGQRHPQPAGLPPPPPRCTVVLSDPKWGVAVDEWNIIGTISKGIFRICVFSPSSALPPTLRFGRRSRFSHRSGGRRLIHLLSHVT